MECTGLLCLSTFMDPKKSLDDWSEHRKKVEKVISEREKYWHRRAAEESKAAGQLDIQDIKQVMAKLDLDITSGKLDKNNPNMLC
jgi:hypothetical protein